MANKKYDNSKYQIRYKEKLKYLGLCPSSVGRCGGIKTVIEVYTKYEHKCDMCGATSNLQVHHKDGKGRHNLEKGLEVNNSLDNLQLLCRSCHGTIHSNQYWGPISKRKGNEVEYDKEYKRKYIREYFQANKEKWKVYRQNKAIKQKAKEDK